MKTSIEKRKYQHARVEITWEECELRDYLNNQFYNTFSEDEKMRIIQTKVTTNKNPWYYPTNGGKDTNDRIFLLSAEEAIKYFGDSGDFEKQKGWYGDGERFDLWLDDGGGQFLNDQYNTARIAKDINGYAGTWWLRSPGRLNIFSGLVTHKGELLMTGLGVDGDSGVRPALWLSY